MYYGECNRVAEALDEVLNLVRRDRASFAKDEVLYYFRGERKNGTSGIPSPIEYPAMPYLLFKEGLVEKEHEIFNEVLRTYPDVFSEDLSTFAKLTRMQHYEIPTRLLDVTPKFMTAVAMSVLPGYGGEDFSDRNGFIRVYRVMKKRVKYSTSDTVVALSNIARVKPENITINDLRYLAAECKNERAGFYWEKGSAITNALERDIRKVWCVRPVVNNRRINAQVGEFFLFGCNDHKHKLNVTFSESDYWNENSATYGIAQIGMITLTPALKLEAKDMSQYLDISEDRVYPDFSRFHKIIKERYEK